MDNTIMDEKIFEKVQMFVSEFCAVKKKKLSPDTQLLKNIGLDGDDAVEFMEAFGQEFDVDLTEFEFSKYFGPEASFNPFMYLYWLFFDRDQLKLIPITLRDLVDAVQKKQWVK